MLRCCDGLECDVTCVVVLSIVRMGKRMRSYRERKIVVDGHDCQQMADGVLILDKLPKRMFVLECILYIQY